MSVISFVILHYGNIEVTKSCVDSILQLDTKDDVHIVVVDNDTHKTLKERQKLKDEIIIKPEVEVIQIHEKSGFSRANNIGYAYTKKMHDPDYVVMANNDILFRQNGFLYLIQEEYKRYLYDVLGPDIINGNNGQHQSPIADSRRTRVQVNYTIWANKIALLLFPLIYPILLCNYNRAKKKKVKSDRVKHQINVIPCGACIVFARKFIKNEEKVFWPETNFYYEEYILYEKCVNNSYSIHFDPEIKVIHGDGVATITEKKNEKRKMRFVMKETIKSAQIYKKLLH